MHLLLIGIGGFCGAIARYALDGWVSEAILIEVVDTEERLRPVLDEIGPMVGNGLVTTERVEVLVYRGGGPAGER